MITNNELDEIQARADAATPGPWGARACGEIVSGRHVVATSDGGGGSVWVEWRTCADLQFTAHARADIPDLVDEVRRLAAAIEQVRELHSGTRSVCGNAQHTNPEVDCPDCDVVCEACGESYPCPTLDALDNPRIIWLPETEEDES